MPKSIYPLLAVLLAALLAACAAPAAQQAGTADEDFYQGTQIDPPAPLTDFTLPSSTGAPIGLTDLRGKPTLIFFGYTSCPDVCPTTMVDFKKAKDELGADSAGVNFVLISVDPERDTPEVLARYLQNFDPAFIGLQGDDATLRRIGRDYGLYYQRHTPETEGGPYLVDHSSAIYLADAEGRLRTIYSYGTPAEVYVRDLRRLMDEG